MEQALQIMKERFGRDSLIALATLDGGEPAVRTVDAYYEDGCFYVVTYALSGKVQQLKAHPQVAVCGEWFTGKGVGENLGHVKQPHLAEVMGRIRAAFAAWYDNGHTNEDDPHTCLVCIRLQSGVLMHQGTRYDIAF